ncbi:quinone oxidoreductase [Xylariaceae sp. FL1019]|nr:quinone oxidoreductase [Xylariaceae sp. FL1019]
MAPKIAIVFYSMYGHVRKLAEAEENGIKAGIKEAAQKLGISEAEAGTVKLFQVPETLPQEVLTKMHAPGQDTSIELLEDPATLQEYDAFLMGIPTRYGNFPTQLKTFWDKTGQQWATGGYYGKMAGMFISTASPGGGQESTAMSAMSTLVHHGIIYVPFGYAKEFAKMSNLDEVHGGSPWGAGTFSSGDGSRQPSQLELDIAFTQGKSFYETVARYTGQQ